MRNRPNPADTGYQPTSDRFRIDMPTALFLLTLFLCCPQLVMAAAGWPEVVVSKDGTPISFQRYGTGEPTLIFVHGWSCDARYWREQIPFFATNYQVVTVDLAGHGHSGSGRQVYSMQAFGEDVAAVAAVIGTGKLILIGHSMGGAVIAEAAQQLGDRVIGLIGVDTLENVEYPMNEEEYNQMTQPLRDDFAEGSRQFVSQMLGPDSDPALREWILADMASAPPAVAMSAMQQMMHQYISGRAASVFDEVRLPVVTVNGDLWPIDHEANRRHMLSFEATVIKGADHFLMMNRPDETNTALAAAIANLAAKR